MSILISLLIFKGTAMTIDYEVKVGEPCQPEQVEQIIADVFNEVDQTFNDYNPNSEVSHLNALPAGEKVAISPEMAHFLRGVKGLVERTDGKFDPTVGGVKRLWKGRTTSPTEEEISTAAGGVGWEKIHFTADTFWKDSSETICDFGGVAKGHCVDMIKERLLEAGLKNLYICWGGEIATAGKHPEGRPWRVGIVGSDQVLELAGDAVATSGDYLQIWEIDGIPYTHICDPRSCRPLQVDGTRSTTVIAPSCMTADALATAAIIK